MNTKNKPPALLADHANSLAATPSIARFLSQFAALMAVLVIALFASNGRATTLYTEDFSYTAGDLITAHGFTAHSGGGTNAIAVVTPGLTYLGYAGSGVGNAASMTTSGEDDNKALTVTASGSIYAAFMVNVSASQTTGDYFAHFGNGSFFSRLYLKKDSATTNFAFGLAKTTDTPTYTGFNYAINTTYLVVIKYTFNTGTTTDDTVSLFVNPTLGGTEPATVIGPITGTATDATASTLNAISLRQGGNTAAATLKVDGIRVATTWSEAAAAVTYTATYNGNTSDGGAAPTDGSSPYLAGSTVTVLGPGTLTKAGYTFAGWNTAANGSGISYTQGATFTIGANTTLYAQWTLAGYLVSYDGNTNTSGTAPVDGGNPYAPGSNVTVLGAGTLTKTGYSFAGWNTAANGSGTAYSPSDTITSIAANVTLYAQWTINSYTVTYDGNGNTGGTAPVDGSSPYTFGSTVTVLGQGSLEKAGYTFAGWNTASDGTGTSYAAAATFAIAGNTTLYAIWTTGASISGAATASAFTTTYGTPSAAQTFSVSGVNLTTDLVATAPDGLEVSSDGSTYGGTATFVQTGGGASGTLSVRLAATATVTGSYHSVSVALTSTGAPPVYITTAASGNSVSPKGLTITGLTGDNKVYDRTTSATFSGTPAYAGLVNSESFSVTGTATASFATKTVATAKTITVSGYTAPTTNYTVTQPTLTADITALSLTVTGATVTSKVYDNTTTATITGATLVGVISGDTVTVSGGGAFADANAGTGKSVTAALTLGGADGGNYSLTQPTLTGDITQATQFISFAVLPDKLTTDAPFNLTATAGSGLTVSFASDNPSVATVSGATVTIVGAGVANITASQAGDGNYGAAVDVVRSLTVSPPALASWDFTGPGNLATQAATVSDAHLASVPVLGRGATAAASTGGNSFRTTGFKNEGIATSNTDYFETSFTAATGYTLSLSTIDARFAGTASFANAPGVSQQFAYSLDGTNFTLIGSAASVIGSPATLAQISLAGIPALQNVPSSTTVTIRYYASGQTTTGGWGFTSVVAGSYGLNIVGTTAVAATPVITGTATASAFTTTYGTASAAQTFPVSGSNLIASITATAPAGFEVSNNGTTYGSTAAFSQTGGNASGTLYVRLAATAPVSGSYNAMNIALTSTGAVEVDITTAASGNSVSALGLTITGLTGVDKEYDGTMAGSVSGTPALVGVIGGDTGNVTVSGTPVVTFSSPAVGAHSLTVSGYTLSGTAAGNYSLTQPTGLTASITAKELTIPDAVVVSKVYDGTTAATITGTLAGAIGGDDVSFVGTGTFASAGPGLGIAVTSTCTLGGAAAGNYTLTQPTGLSGDITGGTGGAISFVSASTTVNPVDGAGVATVIPVQIKREGLTAGTVSATLTAKLSATVPTGQIKLVAGTDYTFTTPQTVTFNGGELLTTVYVTLKSTVRFGQFYLELSAPSGTGASLGAQTTFNIAVNKKDTFAPSLTVTFPTSPASSANVTVSGLATEPGAVVTGIDRIEVTLVNINTTGTTYTTTQTATTSPGFNTLSLSQGIHLDNGSNKITVTAFDKSGNKTAKTATIAFADSAITALAGTYTGLLIPSSSPTNDNSGLLTLTATASTAVSGKLTLGGVAVGFTGSLDSNGAVHFKPSMAKALAVIDKTELESFLGSLSIVIAGNTATGTLSTTVTGGTTIAVASAAKQATAVSPATAANPGLLAPSTLAAQKYTAVFKSTAQAPSVTTPYPLGDGYASITVSPNGSVSAIGSLADGTNYSAAGKLNVVDGATQTVSLFSVLYRKGGSFAVQLVFDTNAATHASYDLVTANSLWIRPNLPHARYYAAGWPSGIVIDGEGARYTVPTGASVLPGLGITSPNAQLTFSDGGVAPGTTRNLDISVKNVFTNKSTDTALKLSIAAGTGIYKGTFGHPDGATAFQGIILQPSGQVSSGYFLDLPALTYGASGTSGKVTLGVHP